MERGIGVIELAYESLIAAGDREAAAECLGMLATFAWHARDSDGVFEPLDRAVELLADAPPSRAKAYVLAQVCRYRMLAGETEGALQVGTEALAMAEDLGLDEVKAAALNSIGTAREVDGDPAGLDDIERSISISLAANSPECVRAYTNLAASTLSLGDLARGIELDEEGIRAAERFGEEIGLRFLRGHQMITSFLSGRWDECLVLADAFIASGEAGSPHAFEAEARSERALISLARDRPEAAIADVRIAVELARHADPQVVEAVLCAAVRVLQAGGHVRDADAIARELLDFWAAGDTVQALPSGFRGQSGPSSNSACATSFARYSTCAARLSGSTRHVRSSTMTSSERPRRFTRSELRPTRLRRGYARPSVSSPRADVRRRTSSSRGRWRSGARSALLDTSGRPAASREVHDGRAPLGLWRVRECAGMSLELT
jgi:hypothetical protein